MLLLLAWCGFLFGYGLSVGTLYRTEALRGIIAAQCLEGDWLVPTLYGEPFLTKPPGMYVAIGVASLPFGHVTEASARLPSALAATATVLFFFFALRRVVGSGGAFAGAMLLPVSLLWLDKAPSAEIDMLQVAWVAGGLLCFLRALEAEDERGARSAERGAETRKASGSERLAQSFPSPPTGEGQGGGDGLGSPTASSLPPTLTLPRRGEGKEEGAGEDLYSLRAPHSALRASPAPRSALLWWFAALLCVAGGFLTKWTAPAFFYLTVLPLLAWRGQFRLLWGWRHVAAVLLAGALCAAWALAVVAQVGWPVLAETVGREAAQRFQPHHHGRAYPWGEVLGFPFLFLATSLPWSALALVALRPSFFRLWDERGRRLLRLLHCWAWPNLLFWTVLPQHAVRYAFPIAPAITGLAVMVGIAWADGRLGWTWPKICPRKAFVAVLMLWAGVKIAYVEAVLPARTANRGARETAAELREAVPVGETLHLFRMKDEGIMFYYGRPVRRLHDPAEIPEGRPVYAVLIDSEWQEKERFGGVEAVRRLRDQQGDPFVLVRLRGKGP